MSAAMLSHEDLLARLAAMAQHSLPLWGHSPRATATLINLSQDAGIETPEPIPAKDGTLIQVLRSPDLADPRHAVMCEFMGGSEPAEEGLKEPFIRLGEVSARMHEHAKHWALPPGFTRHVWDYETSLGNEPHWGRWQDGMGLTPDRLKLLQRLSQTIKRRLDRYGRGRERFGLVHADIRLANLLVEGDR